MYIKQIIIQGFKSYKEQTVIEPFSPKHNVIVGRNGSGKSNFFAAIRFVLSDAYTQLGREERQALLHEGHGAAVMSAFVEIIFDNSDDRFPTGKPEVVLRRTIGLKKDEYSLDRKNATKTDVMNLLESAGFSRSNPYYIVPQGRVTALTNMKDAERLVLLKEVAGTQVYEARRTESLKIMTETNNKREKIDELLDYIKERLAELEEEKEELKDYQDKDKERRCLQYTIDRREQVAIANELENLDEQRQSSVDGTDDNQERFVRNENDLAEIDAEISGLKQQVDFLKVDKKQLENERKESARTKAKIELEVKNLSDGHLAAQQSKAQYRSELESVQKSIKQHERELKEITPRYVAHLQEEGNLKSQLDTAEGTRQRLYAKQGRNARFQNKRERDGWLRNEINNIYPQVAKVKAIRVQTSEDAAQLEQEIASTEEDIRGLRAQLDGRGADNDAIEKESQEARGVRDNLMDERKELWREDAKMDSVIGNAQDELRRAEQELSHTMDQNTSRGLAAVRRIARQHKLEGVYGTLAELLEVNERYRRAVEVTAGNSLFHYVVDNDVTATKIIEVLQKERAGRITFMPLNRIRPRTGNVPKANDAIPMVEKLQFDPLYEKAFQQVFGNTIICPNLTIAGQYARSHGVNGVTMDGDRSDKQGAFTGGSIDLRHSRLQAVRNVAKWRDEFDTQRGRSTEIKRKLERMDQQITKAVGELQTVEQRRLRQENSYGPLLQEVRSKSALLENKKDTLEAKQRAKLSIEANMKSLLDQQNALEAETTTEFQKALTRAEERQLETLSTTVQELRRNYSEASAKRSDLESQKTILAIELRENLNPRLDQLKTRELDFLHGGGGGSGSNTSSGGGSRGGRTIKETQENLDRISSTISVLSNQLLECDSSIEQALTHTNDLVARRTSIQQAQSEIARTIERGQKRMEKSIQKRRILSKQASECAAKIRDLGILPQGSLEKYSKAKSESVVKRLHQVNEALKKYTHVNKKAFEQYANFTGQKATLTARRAELDSSQVSIEELITVLDQRKDEAIERTFKQVSRAFAGVFEKLVPAGRGRLVMQRRVDAELDAEARGQEKQKQKQTQAQKRRQTQQRQQRQEEEDDDERDSDDEEGHRRASVESYTGVGIRVSFNSKHDDQQRIQQLSGGQKSLCALALVFAIQQCDPAPFYLFDEIDANLDAQYRTAVANMLQSIAGGGAAGAGAAGEEGRGEREMQGRNESPGSGQFICTTFRPEMLLVAEKCYGVNYDRKSSSVVVVSREEALDFVEGERQ